MKKNAVNALLILAGSLCYALGYNLFFEPFHISPGGVSGLAMVINYFSGLPVGMTIIALNIPLIITAFLKLGKRFILSTAVTTVISSILIDLTADFPSPVEDLMLAALCGGVLVGTGLGMILRAGSTTGGSDILSKLLQYHKPNLKMGQIVLAVDGAIILITSVVFKNFSLVVYAFISLYITSRIMDSILYGFDFATVTYIISEKSTEIGDAIQAELDRGITYLEALGGYKQTPKRVILCAIKRGQAADLRALIERIDPQAFFIVTEGQQIFGDGFLSKS